MLKRIILKNCQKKINRLRPAVSISLNTEIPTPSLKEIFQFSRIVAKINSLEKELEAKPASFFKEKTFEFKKMIEQRTQNLSQDEDKQALDEILDEILPFYFAYVREAAKRRVKMRHFDVQILGGIVLHKNKIAEMATGEGKTLVATLAASLNALLGKGVHVVTVNDYLANRDREWMGPIYEFLGFSCGVIQQENNKPERKFAYNCDVTYGTNNEFGFDYLRDNMVGSPEEMVQREHFYAIVDEVDSILIDEARTPLIISGPAEASVEKYFLADRLVSQLKTKFIIQSFMNSREGIITLKNIDGSETKITPEELEETYEAIVEEKTHNAYLTLRGEKRCEKALGVGGISEEAPDKFSNPWNHYLTQSLRARYLYRKEKDYIIKEAKVVIVDDFTGRLMPGRRWSDGLHQAVEAKEGLRIEEESQTLATITLQNYFRMYKKLAGMTGTAYTEANEFKHIYNLDTVVIPTNRLLVRSNYPDRIYKTKKSKFVAVISEIEELFKTKRPVLVGTTSIEDSEEFSFLLSKKGIPHNVLNAKYHQREAYIVAQAGRFAQVTIATNMAGRGTDIILGGNIDYFIKDILRKNDILAESPEYKEKYEELYLEYKDKFHEEHNKVVELGGLHIIGTQRHEARRIDNQLRGRSGRQGDPGSSRFYVSLEDDLMRLFGSERIYFLMERFGFPEDAPIEHSLINHSLGIAQRRVEAHNFEIRKQLLEYDNVMNKQREIIYRMRNRYLEEESITEEIFSIADEVIEKNVPFYFEEEENILGLTHWCKLKFGLEIPSVSFDNLSILEAVDVVKKELKKAYRKKEEDFGKENMLKTEKAVALWVLDSHWKEHLLIMDSLKEGIHLRGYAHSEPLVEYQKESYFAFEEIIASIKEGIADLIFKTRIFLPKEAAIFSFKKSFLHSSYSALHQEKAEEKAQIIPKKYVDNRVGRNEPCPCGAVDKDGKPIKYKKCHGK